MPVWELVCPDCGHTFRSLVMAGARVPAVWVCSACGSRRAGPASVEATDPFTTRPGGSGCGCGCG
ncbi:zinc ribbon domain-containing protein [Kineosporia sp. R_H_3]|uniref:zinc ribbon domain-containing protein n=1 Tax=Kineosporia sp. R_H_3 TaxID=1961848 RepID=UPI000B4B28A8|nr:zinc ribbon domain-containing protein [Kineosporia sp. R_H_3]